MPHVSCCMAYAALHMACCCTCGAAYGVPCACAMFVAILYAMLHSMMHRRAIILFWTACCTGLDTCMVHMSRGYYTRVQTFVRLRNGCHVVRCVIGHG